MLLEVNDVTVSYGQTPVLFGANLAVNQGEIACILGRNGVGKTTLLRSIIGLNKVMSGNIIFDIQNITRLPIFKRARAGIAYIPQGREIIPYLSVLDNLKLGLSAGNKKLTKIPHEIFEFFPMLKQHLNRQGGLLSGGQQQQLAIARGLMSDPKIMLLDEPTEGIQPSIAQEIAQVLRKLVSEKGISILLVEQKIDFASQVSDYYYFMDRGKMVLEGSRDNLDQTEIKKHLSV